MSRSTYEPIKHPLKTLRLKRARARDRANTAQLEQQLDQIKPYLTALAIKLRDNRGDQT